MTIRTYVSVSLLMAFCTCAAPGQVQYPTRAEVDRLLAAEPLTLQSWPTWRKRLLAWIDDRSRQVDPAYEAAWSFMNRQAGPSGELAGDLKNDYLAWYFLGNSYFQGSGKKPHPNPDYVRAERALRESIRLEPTYARSHRNLALVLMSQDRGPTADTKLLERARLELDEAQRLDPKLPLAGLEGQLAFRKRDVATAEKCFRDGLAQDPQEAGLAMGVALCLLNQAALPGKQRVHDIQELVERFPEAGELRCFLGVALAMDRQMQAAKEQLARARNQGVDPARILAPQVVTMIESDNPRGLLAGGNADVGGGGGGAGGMSFFELLAMLGVVLLFFAAFYAVVMVLMALAGWILAARTRGTRALDLIDRHDGGVLENGQIARSEGESGLARLYALALFGGLILFYASLPFVLAGLLGATAFFLSLIFMMGRIPVKLVIIVVVAGLGMAWAVLKSIFSKPASGGFGITKTAAEQPRLFELVRDVAHRVDTEAVDEIYLAPGSEIGVHQEGRGPFGIFGVKRRVLTLGMSTMRSLTISELQSILAHEYAHFSHKDTFYNRFIYQVHLSLAQALNGMAQAGGYLNYVNPFFWFFFLYYKCYTILSAGFSRSREFLADRMASHLCGSDVFATALTKVCTDAPLFESTVYQNIAGLLDQNQAFVNIYQAFHEYREQQVTQEEKDRLRQQLLEEKESLFATHPTFKERIEAVVDLPMASKTNDVPARELFADPEETEKELTVFLTEYVHVMRQYQAALEANAAQ